MSATIYKWIIVYDDGTTEEKWGAAPYSFADDLEEVPAYMCGDCLCRVCARNECGDNYVEGIDNDCLGCNGCNGTVDLLEDCPKEAFVPDDE